MRASPKTAIVSALLIVAGLSAAIGWWKLKVIDGEEIVPLGGSGQSSTSPTPTTVDRPVLDSFAHLRESPTREAARARLSALQNDLVSMPRDQALAQIVPFLGGGSDAPTGLSFEIGTGGTLKEWPTFRTFLLDVLLAVDPDTAAQISRAILESPTTADEWALALRNLGRLDSSEEVSAFLRAKTEALITHPDWQAHPSVGYLNAFDVLVHTHATASTPLLSSLVQRKDRQDLAHAAFLTLDRLVQREPVDLFTRLAADRPLHHSRPEMVAQTFARADVRIPAQREILRHWLLDPARTGTELRSFAAAYPNANQFISHNLLTTEPARPGADIGAHDHQAFPIVAAWTHDPEFQTILPHLHTMLARLSQFVTAPDR